MDRFVHLNLIYPKNPEILLGPQNPEGKKVSDLRDEDVYLCVFSVRASHIRAVTIPHWRIAFPMANSLIHFYEYPLAQATQSREEVVSLVQDAERE